MKKVYQIMFYVLFTAIVANIIFADEITLSSESVEYRKLEYSRYQRVKGLLTPEEYFEDLEALEYLITAGYAGYEEMVERGFNVKNFHKNITEQFDDKDEIITRDFYFAVTKELKPYISDSHFIISHYTDTTSFSDRKFVAWSDIFVTNNGEEYLVSESTVPEINKGDKFNGSQENLFYYPVKGKETYRIGVLTDSDTQKTSKTFTFNSRDFSVPLKQDGAIQVRPMKFKEFETENSAYIALNCFLFPEAEDSASRAANIIFKKFINLGKKYNKKKTIILDLRTNMGGDPLIPLRFSYGLYKNCKTDLQGPVSTKLSKWHSNSFFERKQIYSPAYLEIYKGYLLARNYTGQANNISRQIEEIKKAPVRKLVLKTLNPSGMFKKKPKFKGKLIILTDRNTVSAGEFAIIQAKHILGEKNVIVVGENTWGMAAFWNIMDVQLPNSKINIHTAFGTGETIRKNKNWHGEGTGLFPDYWCTGNDLNETIFMISGDTEMKEKLKDIEFRLM